jgi:hypothetical protein
MTVLVQLPEAYADEGYSVSVGLNPFRKPLSNGHFAFLTKTQDAAPLVDLEAGLALPASQVALEELPDGEELTLAWAASKRWLKRWPESEHLPVTGTDCKKPPSLYRDLPSEAEAVVQSFSQDFKCPL